MFNAFRTTLRTTFRAAFSKTFRTAFSTTFRTALQLRRIQHIVLNHNVIDMLVVGTAFRVGQGVIAQLLAGFSQAGGGRIRRDDAILQVLLPLR